MDDNSQREPFNEKEPDQSGPQEKIIPRDWHPIDGCLDPKTGSRRQLYVKDYIMNDVARKGIRARLEMTETMIETVKGDLRPGTSAIVLLSSGAEIDAVVHAFEGQPTELIRSDLSVPEQDQLRQAVELARQRKPGQESLSRIAVSLVRRAW